MAELRSRIKSGDIPKAKMLANQMAHYRNISDKNFARAIYIQTETQIRNSNHKINQAQVEFVKTMSFVNNGESIESIRAREKKYHMRQDVQASIEGIMNEGFEEVYEDQDDERDCPLYFDQEVSAIFREAIDPKLKSRNYSLEKTDEIRKFVDDHVMILLRVYQDGDCADEDLSKREAAIQIPTLEISVDMLKRYINRDSHIVKQLGILDFSGNLTNIQIGTLNFDLDRDKGTFCSFGATASLKGLGLKENDILWLCIN